MIDRSTREKLCTNYPPLKGGHRGVDGSMTYKYLPRNRSLRPLAAKLRTEATKEERILWKSYLSNYPIRFYRQRIIGSYIVDFYCHQAKLVIELDGSQHYLEENRPKEEERNHYLRSLDLYVLRFSNLDILQNLAGVCNEIDRVVAERTKSS